MTAVAEIGEVAAQQSGDASGEPARKHGRRWLIGGAVAGAALVAGYVGTAFAVSDELPNGMTVSGVPVGGMEPGEAAAAIEEALAARLQDPLTVTLGEKGAQIVPAQAGLRFDAAATLAPYTGLSFSPVVLWQHLFGGASVEVATGADAAALTTALEQVSDALTTAPTEGAVALVAGQVQVTDAAAGLKPNIAGAVETLSNDWMTGQRLPLPGDAVEPQVGQAAVDSAAAQAKVVLGAPVTVQIDGSALQLSAEQLGQVITFEPVDGDLVAKVDGEAVQQLLASQLAAHNVAPKDAKVEIADGKPRVVPAVDGKQVTAQALAEAIEKAAVSNQNRNAPVSPEAKPAEFSTKDAEALGIKEVIADFSTPLTWETRRTANIARGSELVNGTIVRPGETFSLEQTLGEVDAHTGFVDAGVIINGIHTDSMGGGLSQLATNVFNAGFLAGFVDVEHRPHTEYLSRYPEGREATLWTGHLDVKWTNDTPYAALLEAGVTDDVAWIKVWSTKHWNVEHWTSERFSYRPPTKREVFTKPCEPQEEGGAGFSVTVTRVRSHGEVKESQDWTTHYQAVDEIVCK